MGGGSKPKPAPDPYAAERRRKAEEEARKAKEERFISLLERGTGRLGAPEGREKKGVKPRGQGVDRSPVLSKIEEGVELALGGGFGKSFLGR